MTANLKERPSAESSGLELRLISIMFVTGFDLHVDLSPKIRLQLLHARIRTFRRRKC